MRMQDKRQQVVCRAGGRLVHGTARIARVTLNDGVWRGVFNGLPVVRIAGDVWQIVEG